MESKIKSRIREVVSKLGHEPVRGDVGELPTEKQDELKAKLNGKEAGPKTSATIGQITGFSS